MKTIFLVRLWFVILPTLAFGQTVSECRDRQLLTEMAIEVKDRVDNGESMESLQKWADEIETPGLQAAGYKAVEAYTFSPPSKDMPVVVTAMAYLCNKSESP